MYLRVTALRHSWRQRWFIQARGARVHQFRYSISILSIQSFFITNTKCLSVSI